MVDSVTITSNEVAAVQVPGAGTSEADLVSVIILALEDDADIEPVLQSVETQSHAVIDVIVVHCGTTRAADQMSEEHPKVIFVAERGNSAMAARSSGLRMSKGEYVVFLSTGDRLLPRALDIAVSSLRARPSCALAFGTSRPFGDVALAIAESQRTRTVRSDFFVELLRGDFIGKAGGAMYRRSALIDAEARMGSRGLINDYHLNLEITRENEVCFHGALVAEHATSPLPSAREVLVSARGELDALRAQRRYVRGHRHAEAAYREGLQAIGNKVFLVSSHYARRHAAARAWGTVATIAAKSVALEAACFAQHPKGLVRLFRTELAPWIARRFGTARRAMRVSPSPFPNSAYSSKQTISQIIWASLSPALGSRS